MKNIFWCAVVCFFFSEKIYAQTFSVIGNDSLIEDISANNISIHDIFLQNETFSDDTLAYQVLSFNLISGWDASLCVNGSCQVGVPMSGVMAPFAGGTQGLMGFNVNPYLLCGTSTLLVKVWDIHDTTSKANLYWQLTLHPADVNSIEENGISIYPNPVHKILNVKSELLNAGTISVFDIFGKEILDERLSTINYQLSTVSYYSGIYFLEIKTEDGKTYRTKFVKE